MFKLNDPLIDEIEFREKFYPLNMSFDVVIDVIEALDDEDMTTDDKVEYMLDVMVGERILDDANYVEKQSVVKQINNLINLEPIENRRVDIDGNPMPEKKGDKHKQQLVSFLYDAKYIFAAFQQAYGIDLINEQGTLHWVKFSALMNALPDDTLMRQIIGWRGTKLSDIKDKGERKRIKELQEKFKLPNSEPENEEEGGNEYGE